MDHPVDLAGESSPDKRARIAKILHDAGQTAAVLTLPDSISWLLNIRGSDIPKNPVVHAFAILHADGRVALYLNPEKVAHLGPDPGIDVHPPEAFDPALRALHGPVRVDKSTAPLAVSRILHDAGVEVAWGDDPCILPKARKNETELKATAEAHLRDGAAMVEFLAWLDREAPKGKLTEIDVVKALEGFRRATNALHDISFDTICGAGPNGAIVHYRVTDGTNRKVAPGELLLIDSGGQYVDGTTDITRTVAVGAATEEQRACFTRVLQGMIAISRARWPRGLAGRDLDALARAPLWMAGMDYDHGTGHGVGAFLCVHEGPQRLSRISEVPLEPGMILSNEPGYYREGAFGIRIENLIVVREAPKLGDGRDQLCLRDVDLGADRSPPDRRRTSCSRRAQLDQPLPCRSAREDRAARQRQAKAGSTPSRGLSETSTQAAASPRRTVKEGPWPTTSRSDVPGEPGSSARAARSLARSTNALELTEGSYPAVIYFPRGDIAMAFLDKTDKVTTCPCTRARRATIPSSRSRRRSRTRPGPTRTPRPTWPDQGSIRLLCDTT
jgi:Xaa-Pro aminopeptidase